MKLVFQIAAGVVLATVVIQIFELLLIAILAVFVAGPAVGGRVL